MKLKIFLISLLITGLIITGFSYFWWLKIMKTPEHGIKGLIWPQSKPLTDFHLIDHNGHPFTLEDLKGQWHFMFFGYTHCPDICPVTLTILREVKEKLVEYGKYAKNTQYIFVSVDSERDTPKHLAQYIKYFHPEFIGVTASSKQINQLTRQVGIVYIRRSGSVDGNYFIDHSSTILLINPQGEMVGVFSPPHTSEAIVSRYIQIRQFFAEVSS